MSRGLDLRGRGAHVRISILLVCIAFLTLLVPALARADRGPTGLERAGIEAAAQREFGQAHAQAKVSDIRVSTKNRAWATAAVAVDNGAADQSYQAEFHRKRKGNWGPADNEMPAAVEDDLGLSDTGGSVDKVVRIGTFAVLGLLALGILWAISAGLSKLGLGGSSDPDRSVPSRAATPPKSWTPSPTKQRKTCTACGGRGKSICMHCGGRGQIERRNPESGSGITLVGCPACGTQGGQACSLCSGKGWTE